MGGTTKLGNYELLAQVGRGGMGAVYRARQLGMERIVAIKVLPRSFAADERFVQRFLREARLAGQCSHPNLIHVHEVGKADGYYFYSMEFVGGPTLKLLLQEDGPMDQEMVVYYISSIAAALEEAHERGIVHRDVKPENIILSERGDPKLADLGLAKPISGEMDVTADSSIVSGTPFYMSPEQCRAEELDGRSDLYSLGATAYHLLTGKTSVSGTSLTAIAIKHATETPKPLRQVKPECCTRGMEAVVMKLLEKDRNDRYATAREVIEDLEAVAAGRRPRYAKVAVAGETVAGEKPRRRREPTSHLKKPPAKRIGTGMILGGIGAALVLIMLIALFARTPSAPVPAPDTPPSPEPGPSAAPETPPSSAPASPAAPATAYRAAWKQVDAKWTKKPPEPLFRIGMGGVGTAYDSRRGLLIMYSAKRDFTTDPGTAWAYDTGSETWDLLFDEETCKSQKPVRINLGHNLTYDPHRDCYWTGRGTDVWRYDPKTKEWQKHIETKVQVNFLAYVPVTHQLLETEEHMRRTRMLDPDGGVVQTPAQSPLAHRWGTVHGFLHASDPNGRFLFFGGKPSSGREFTNTTVLFDAERCTWTVLQPKNAPSPRTYGTLSYNGRIGGWVMVSRPDSQSPFEVWIYHPSLDTWILADSEGIPANFGGGFGYDPKHGIHVFLSTSSRSDGTWTCRITPK